MMIEESELELDNFFATIQNPYPVYAYPREHDPVRWNPMFGVYMLSKFDDVNMAFSDFRRFSSDIWSSIPEAIGFAGDDEASRYLSQIIPFMADNLQGMDPPGHTRQRTLMPVCSRSSSPGTEMATLLPSSFPSDHSKAEHLIYRKLRDETPAEWTATGK